MQVTDAHDCLILLAALLIAAAAAAQDPVGVREYTPVDEYDWQLTRRLSGLAGIPASHGHWPALALDTDAPAYGSGIELLAEVDGLVAGRVQLEAHHHPYCELVNLCVRPDCEGMGVATALVRECILQARRLGFKVMVLQESLDEGAAHGIYEKAGFVPATRGDMQRMVKLLDVPLVSGLLAEFPDAELVSEPPPDRGDNWWRLSWHAGPEDSVALYLRGGSCQFDSDGFQPVIQACEFARGGVALAAKAEVDAEMARGAVNDLRITLRNLGANSFEGAVRAMLLPDTEIAGEAALGAIPVKLQPAQEQTVVLPIRLKHQFRCDSLPFGSYPSVPLTAEVCWDRGSVLLSGAVKITSIWGGGYPG